MSSKKIDKAVYVTIQYGKRKMSIAVDSGMANAYVNGVRSYILNEIEVSFSDMFDFIRRDYANVHSN